MSEDLELVPGAVYRKVGTGDADTSFSLMSSLKSRGEAVLGLLFSDAGRIPIRRYRGQLKDPESEWQIVARPLPIRAFNSLMRLVDLVDDIIEIVDERRARKGR